MELKKRLHEAKIAAMRSKDKDRLGVVRLMLADIQQHEVDNQVELKDPQIITLLDKMIKKRRQSIEQYEKANRDDLAKVEAAEILIIQEFLPKQLTDEELNREVAAAVNEAGAASLKDMKKAMECLTPKIIGRADVAKASQKVREILTLGSDG